MPRFSLKTLLIGVAVCAIALGAWSILFRKVANFKPTRPDHPVEKRESPHLETDECERDITLVQGKCGQHFVVTLFALHAGNLKLRNESILDPNLRRNAVLPTPFEVTLLLKTRTFLKDTVTTVEDHDGLMNTIEWRVAHEEIPADFTYALARTITSGRPYIIYVEGDSPINATPGMALAEFAKLNSGNYFVVTAELK